MLVRITHHKLDAYIALTDSSSRLVLVLRVGVEDRGRLKVDARHANRDKLKTDTERDMDG